MPKEQTDPSTGSSGQGDNAEVYLAAIRREIPRLLSLVDRDPNSKTFGCLDRTYWAWKFTDFPGARFQEGVYALSFFYTTAFVDNPLYQNQSLLRWLTGAIYFWRHIQRPGGDFDEAYPLERSLAATAFSTFYISEAFQLLRDDSLSQRDVLELESTIARAGDWLVRNDETHGFLSNHLAAAAGALYHAHRITGQDQYRQRARYFIDKILKHQSSEGWYEEYGGADPGYQTHGSFYLSRCFDLSGDEDIARSLERANQFLSHFIHPDLSIGGEYASRNTQTYYPAAFEISSRWCGAASWIKSEMLPAVENAAAAGLQTVDVYNYFPMLNNYIFAYLAATADDVDKEQDGPDTDDSTVNFPAAGILKVRRRKYDAYVGTAKGGVVKLFNRDTQKLVYNDCGFVGKTSKNRVISSQWFEPKRRIEVSDNGVAVEGAFYEISRPVMTPMLFLGFRAFTLTVGRIKKIGYWLKSLLVKVLIYRKSSLDIRLRRELRFKDDGIVVTDCLSGDDRKQIRSLTSGEVFTTIHMGSSRYFIPNELATQPIRQMDDGFLYLGEKLTTEIRIS